MDELEISGKRFISSKRAAKENRYHVDYIGQLIRGGKIVGSKVGRTWYVEAESLATYLGKEYKAPVSAIQVNNYAPVEVPVSYKKDYIGYESQDVPQEEKPTFAGLTYLSDDEPLMPVQDTYNAWEEELPEPVANVKISTNKIAGPKQTLRSVKKVVLVGVAAAALAFGVAVSASYLILSTNTVDGTQNTASLTFSLKK